MKIRVNGEEREVPQDLTVDGLVGHLAMPGERVAIERNLEILPRAVWKTTLVEANDSYEIVQFVGGG